MRRRRRNRPFHLMTAVLVELGAMTGIVAVAQPTWTRGVLDRVSAPVANTLGVSSPSGESLPVQGNVVPESTWVLPPPLWQAVVVDATSPNSLP